MVEGRSLAAPRLGIGRRETIAAKLRIELASKGGIADDGGCALADPEKSAAPHIQAIETGVPTIFADILFNTGISGGAIDLTFGCLRITPTADGKTKTELPIVSRLRIDLETATFLRNALDAQIALLTKPQSKPN